MLKNIYLISYHLKLRSFRTNCRSTYPLELFLLPSPKISRRRSRKVLAILVIICMIYTGHLISLASSNESKGSIGITVYVTCTQYTSFIKCHCFQINSVDEVTSSATQREITIIKLTLGEIAESLSCFFVTSLLLKPIFFLKI